MSDIKERVVRVARTRLRLSPDIRIENESDLKKDFGIDPIDHIGFLMGIEAEFGLEISIQEAAKVQTIQQTIDLVNAKKH